MYCNGNNVAGTGGRIVNRANCITADEFCRRRCNGNNVSPDTSRRCNFVYECLLELLEDALEDNNNNNGCVRNCDFVYECLDDLLEDAVEDTSENNRCKCHKYC